MASVGMGSPTWPSAFVSEIATRLVEEVPKLQSDRVFESMWPDEDHLLWPPADRFITLFNNDFPVDAPGVSGGGSYTTCFESTLLVNVFVRLEPDLEGRSAQQLSEQTKGTYQFIRQVLQALQTWPGVLDGTHYRFRRPMRIRRFTVQRRSGEAGKSRWAHATMNWEVSFVSSIGSNYTGL